MEIERSESVKTLEINEKHVDFLISMLSAEECRLKDNLVHLKRKQEDTEGGKEVTWWSGGCKVQPSYAANLMYDTLERLAMIDSLNKQLAERS